MENTKLKLLRVLDILNETDEDHPITANEIVARLKLYGIDAERKSVLRDIAALQNYGYDILLSPDNKLGYFMASRLFEDWELKVLMDAAASAGFLTSENAGQLIDKLSSLSSLDGRKTLRLATPVFTHVKNGDPTTKNSITVLLDAFRKKRKVGFQYTYTDKDMEKRLRYEGREYQVSPYALIWRMERYYLVCCYGKYETLSYYRLDRIRNLHISDEPVLSLENILGPNPEIGLKEYVNKTLYNYGGESTIVTLAVDKSRVDLLVDTFGNDYHVLSHDDDRVIASVSVNDGWGLTSWLLQNGDCVEILEPESARQDVIRSLENMQKKYQK